MTDDQQSAEAQDPQTEQLRQTAGLLPVLAGLDATVNELDQANARGDALPPGLVSSYEQQTAHARHLITSAGLSSDDLEAAERQHHGDGERGFAARGYEHALAPRPYEQGDLDL